MLFSMEPSGDWAKLLCNKSSDMALMYACNAFSRWLSNVISSSLFFKSVSELRPYGAERSESGQKQPDGSNVDESLTTLR